MSEWCPRLEYIRIYAGGLPLASSGIEVHAKQLSGVGQRSIEATSNTAR